MSTRTLMSEMTNSGERHRHAVLIGGGNHLIITARAARLNDGRDAVGSRYIDAITKWKEGIRGQYRATGLDALIARLECGDSGRVDAAALTGSDANGAAVACEHDGVRFDELRHLPGKQQIGELEWRGLAACGDLE